MKRCPITYDVIHGKENYSQRGLHLLSPQLHHLKPLSLSASEQRTEGIARAGRMSIQGVQIKLSAQLKIKEEKFEIVDSDGRYILKPQSEYYPELPENEAVTMTLASMIDIEVPVHGLIYNKDKEMTYFIRRFDRTGRNKKIAVEDFSQLSMMSRDTKYNSSIEKAVKIVMTFCSFPKIESIKLLKLILFNYLVGNEDMHLKNFSLITQDKKITLSPAYDLLNTTIAQKNVKEELALPLNGRKNNLRKNDFIDYLAIKILQLNEKTIESVLQKIASAIPQWKKFIEISFLSEAMKKKYLSLLEERIQKLNL